MYSIITTSRIPIVLVSLLQRRIQHKELLLMGQCIQRNIVSSSLSSSSLLLNNYKPLLLFLSQSHYGDEVRRNVNNRNHYNNNNSSTKRSFTGGNNNSFNRLYTKGNIYITNTFYSIYRSINEWMLDIGNMSFAIGCGGIVITLLLLIIQYEPKNDTINTNIEKQNKIIHNNKERKEKKKQKKNKYLENETTYKEDE